MDTKIAVSVGTVITLLVANGLAAQEERGTGAGGGPLEINAGIEFNFTNPGARSLGVGGAFLALADDATAAYTNPAGLTALSKSEISAEFRGFRFTNTFLDGGRVFSLVSGPSEVGIDTRFGIVNGETAHNRTSGLSFLSAVYASDRFALAGYRREVANFDEAFETTGAFFNPEMDEIPGLVLEPDVQALLFSSRLLPIRTDLSLKIVDLGVSGAVDVGSGVSLGAGLSIYDFSLEAVTNRYGLRAPSLALVSFGGQPVLFVEPFLELEGGFWGPPLFDDDNVHNTDNQRGDDTDVAINLGFLWRANDTWSFGAIFRQGPTFEFDLTNVPGPGASSPVFLVQLFPAPAPGADPVVLRIDPTIRPGFRRPGRFKVPDVYGLGFAFRPKNNIKISVDYDRVQYSQLAEGFAMSLFEPAEASNYTTDDANEFHFGFEYLFVGMRYPLAVRFGLWHDPDHKLRYDGLDPGLRASFQGGEDEFHYAGGVGAIFGERFSIDAALDYSERRITTAFSAVFRF
jgi:long-subunit fatty acid transport protein